MIRHDAIRSQHGRRKAMWTRARVKRLCQILRITQAELVAYLDWGTHPFNCAMKSNSFPGPVCIVLELYEQYAYRVYLGEDRKLDLPFPGKVT